ncbi:protein of unknown function [Serratia sp. Tan611]|nr:protein of unknown function [Serratia sp. Tan611]
MIPADPAKFFVLIEHAGRWRAGTLRHGADMDL